MTQIWERQTKLSHVYQVWHHFLQTTLGKHTNKVSSNNAGPLPTHTHTLTQVSKDTFRSGCCNWWDRHTPLPLGPNTPPLCYCWTCPADDKRSRVWPRPAHWEPAISFTATLTGCFCACACVCVYVRAHHGGCKYLCRFIVFLFKGLDFTLIRELMTIAPAFTMGLCGLSVWGRRAYLSFGFRPQEK